VAVGNVRVVRPRHPLLAVVLVALILRKIVQ
jgi:hypothetical protein